jgi:DnaJ-class molecular chaperone
MAEIAKPEPKICTRCGGDGVFHSSRTGVRARTSAEPPVDPSRVCPKCKGTGTI